MPDIFDIDPISNYMGLYTGANGSGKSIAIGSWKKRGSIYYFDFDGRMASVANYYQQRGLKRGQLEYDTYGPHNLYDSMQKLDSFLDYCPHAAIVIDSFTAVTVSAVTFSLKRRAGKGGNYLPTTSKGDMVIPDWDEFKGETVCVTQMLDLCKAIAAKGVAVFWTAHPVITTKIESGNKSTGEKDKYGKQVRYAAYGFKTDSLLPIYFNEIYYFTTSWDWSEQRNERICLTQPSQDIVHPKTALNLPVEIKWTDSDFYDIFSSLAIEGHKLNQQKGEEVNDLENKEEKEKKDDEEPPLVVS